VAVEFYYIKH